MTGTPSAAQCLWLSAQFFPIRQLLHSNSKCATVDGLQVLMQLLLEEVDTVCVKFATLVWAGAQDQPLLVASETSSISSASTTPLSTEALSMHDSCDAASEGSVDSSSSDKSITWQYIPERLQEPPMLKHDENPTVQYNSAKTLGTPSFKPSTSKPPTPKMRRSNKTIRKSRHGTHGLSLSNMSKAEYKRRFGGKKKAGKKKKTTNFCRVVTHKDLVRFLADSRFTQTSHSSSSDLRYERPICGCGQCASTLEPGPECAAPRTQILCVMHPSSRTKTNYYRNKRMDVDKLTERALADYRAHQ